MTLEDLELSARAYGALYRHGILRVEDAAALTLEELAKIPGMGGKTAAEVFTKARKFKEGKENNVAENNESRVYSAAIEKWGASAQILMVFEEMSELQKELCKNARGKKNLAEIAEEIADVEIMLAQLKLIFGCAELVQEHKEHKERKIARLAARLEG